MVALLDHIEPFNTSRFIIGFDTFEGFKSLDKNDDRGIYKNKELFKEFTERQSFDEIVSSLNLQKFYEGLKPFAKISVVKGNALKTIPNFIKENHTIVSLLHLDFDIYKPFKIAIEKFLPRMPKGSVIALDGTNCPEGPGEAIALLECLDINKVQIKRNSFDSFPLLSFY